MGFSGLETDKNIFGFQMAVTAAMQLIIIKEK